MNNAILQVRLDMFKELCREGATVILEALCPCSDEGQVLGFHSPFNRHNSLFTHAYGSNTRTQKVYSATLRAKVNLYKRKVNVRE
jgi:hypothetical protein